MFKVTFPSGRTVIPALIVIDMQNGFVSKGGSYDKIGMNTSLYREIIPKLKDLMGFCRSMDIPVFYTEAVKESSGIDILTNVHNILPKSRQERLKVPICIRGTWDGVTIDELTWSKRSCGSQTKGFCFPRYRIPDLASESRD
jgi:ureidoacrylate peracid hydrolase